MCPGITSRCPLCNPEPTQARPWEVSREGKRLTLETVLADNRLIRGSEKMRNRENMGKSGVR